MLFVFLAVFYTDMFRRRFGFLTGKSYLPVFSNLGNRTHTLYTFYRRVYLLARSYRSSLGNSICTGSQSD